MGLQEMLYGPDRYDPDTVSIGTLELLGLKAIVISRLMDENEYINSVSTWAPSDDAQVETAAGRRK